MHALTGLRSAVALLMLLASAQVFAANVTFVGQVGYAVDGNTVDLAADRAQNNDAGGVSGALRMELWAYPAPYSGTAQTGYRTAVRDLGQLAGGASISNISGPVPFTQPPAGTWYFTLFLTEFTGASGNDGYSARVYATFPTPVVFGPGGTAFVPSPGIWWNPAESGTGYAVQVRHGVLVMIFYSFKTSGDSEWYLVSGTLTENGTTLASTLDKYRGGQCAGCAYTGAPVSGGNDGPVTIRFSSSTAGTITYPGGRVVPIQPYLF